MRRPCGHETSARPASVDAPLGCDASADAKDAPKCVVSEFGVFVDASGGSDTNPGTQESPMETLTAAQALILRSQLLFFLLPREPARPGVWTGSTSRIC